MKKIILALILCVCMAVPAQASQDGTLTFNLDGEKKLSEPVTVTKTAHVVHIPGARGGNARDRKIALYFEPFTFANEGDEAQRLQYVPYYGTPQFRSDGRELQSVLVPGQEVKVTFTYRMRETGTAQKGGKTYPLREMELVSCQRIDLVGKALLLGEHADMRRDIFIGTVLEVKANRLTIYAEGTPVYDGDDEYIAQGRLSFELTEQTKFNATARDSIKPFTRVEIKASNGEWMESAPPQFAGGKCESVTLLKYGEKWNVDSALREITVAVKEQVKNESGLTELLCIPINIYERFNNPVVKLEGWFDEGLSAYKPGTIVTARYLAVNNALRPPVYTYVHDIRVNPNRRLTAQELSGVFGKPGDVSVTVTKEVIGADEENIPVILKNKTSTEIMFGNDYRLAYKKDGKWYRYNNPKYTDEVYFTEEAHMVLPGSEMEFAFSRSLLTDRLPAGTYRVITDFTAGKLGDDEPPTFDYIIGSNEFTVR